MTEIENKTPIVSPKERVPQEYGIHRFPLQPVFLLSLVFGALSFLFSAKGLPDYNSYEGLYESVTDYHFFGWEPFFVYLNYLGRYFQLSYDEFRSIILFLSLSSFTAALYIFSQKLQEAAFRFQKQNIFFAILVGLIFTFAITVFYFEFFVIRIRAGLAISIVCLAFSLFWPGRNNSHWLKFLTILILLALAFASHMQTTTVLVYFLFYPAFISILYSKRWFARKGFFFKILLFCAVFIPAVLVVCAIIKMGIYRGEHLFSELNVFRPIAWSVIPLIIAVFGVFNKTFVGLTSLPKTLESNSNGALVDRTACHLISWHYYATFSYVSMAFALLLFYMAGVVYPSGEAIVRLFTLASPLAIFIVLTTTGFYRFFWLFLLTSNSLFFVKTVFLSNL